VLKAGASAFSARDGGSRFAATMRTVATSAAQISIFVAAESFIARRPWAFSANGVWGLLRRGKSSIRRSEIARESAFVHRSPGNCKINAANLCAAVNLGSSDSSAASFQGSMSSRASAERTLRGISFLSAAMGAYRKSSNSGLKKETELAGVIMIPHCRASPPPHAQPRSIGWLHTFRARCGPLSEKQDNQCQEDKNASRKDEIGRCYQPLGVGFIHQPRQDVGHRVPFDLLWEAANAQPKPAIAPGNCRGRLRGSCI
jgi:hypothetical protein